MLKPAQNASRRLAHCHPRHFGKAEGSRAPSSVCGTAPFISRPKRAESLLFGAWRRRPDGQRRELPDPHWYQDHARKAAPNSGRQSKRDHEVPGTRAGQSPVRCDRCLPQRCLHQGAQGPRQGLRPGTQARRHDRRVCYRPGETAEDNNIYASALASILPTPGLRAEEVFKETQLKVADLSKGLQIPWTEDGLLTKF